MTKCYLRPCNSHYFTTRTIPHTLLLHVTFNTMLSVLSCTCTSFMIKMRNFSFLCIQNHRSAAVRGARNPWIRQWDVHGSKTCNTNKPPLYKIKYPFLTPKFFFRRKCGCLKVQFKCEQERVRVAVSSCGSQGIRACQWERVREGGNRKWWECVKKERVDRVSKFDWDKVCACVRKCIRVGENACVRVGVRTNPLQDKFLPYFLQPRTYPLMSFSPHRTYKECPCGWKSRRDSV